jgi:hypothetical protein
VAHERANLATHDARGLVEDRRFEIRDDSDDSAIFHRKPVARRGSGHERARDDGLLARGLVYFVVVVRRRGAARSVDEELALVRTAERELES